MASTKTAKFTPPTPQEVFAYAYSNGYLIEPERFIDFYEANNWKDSRDKPIKNWKLKMRMNWFRNARKLEPVEGAPEGYEYWYATQDGKYYYPDRWKRGKPYSKDGLVTDLILQEQYKAEIEKGS